MRNSVNIHLSPLQLSALADWGSLPLEQLRQPAPEADERRRRFRLSISGRLAAAGYARLRDVPIAMLPAVLAAAEAPEAAEPAGATDELDPVTAARRAALLHLSIDELYASGDLLSRDERAWRSEIGDRLIAVGCATVAEVPMDIVAGLLYREQRTPLEHELLHLEMGAVVDAFGSLTAEELRALAQHTEHAAGAELISEAGLWATRLDHSAYRVLADVPVTERELFVT